MTVLDRGDPLDSESWTVLLVHEMVHALQDASGENVFLGFRCAK